MPSGLGDMAVFQMREEVLLIIGQARVNALLALPPVRAIGPHTHLSKYMTYIPSTRRASCPNVCEHP